MQALEDVRRQVLRAELWQDPLQILPEQNIKRHEWSFSLTDWNNGLAVFAEPCPRECIPVQLIAARLEIFLGLYRKRLPRVQHSAEHIEEQCFHAVFTASHDTLLCHGRTAEKQPRRPEYRTSGECCRAP